VAAGSATANAPNVAIAARGTGNASGTGTAHTPQASIAASAGVGSATGTGQTPTTKVAPPAEAASGTGTAHDATAQTSGQVFILGETEAASTDYVSADPSMDLTTFEPFTEYVVILELDLVP
jgi:hypothetical protein